MVVEHGLLLRSASSSPFSCCWTERVQSLGLKRRTELDLMKTRGSCVSTELNHSSKTSHPSSSESEADSLLRLVRRLQVSHDYTPPLHSSL